MYNTNILLILFSKLFAQVICSFGMITLWNPIKRAARSDNIIYSLKKELHWLLPAYIIIKIIENSIVISMSYTRGFVDGVELTIESIILAVVFVVACSFSIKFGKQLIKNN